MPQGVSKASAGEGSKPATGPCAQAGCQPQGAMAEEVCLSWQSGPHW